MNPGDSGFGALDDLIAETDLELESQFQALEGQTALNQATAELAAAERPAAGGETVEGFAAAPSPSFDDPLRHLKDRFTAKRSGQAPYLQVTCPKCSASSPLELSVLATTPDPRCAACAAALVVRP